jgi:hypothetical protein
MLIINHERYIARIISGGVSWVKIQRRNDWWTLTNYFVF